MIENFYQFLKPFTSIWFVYNGYLRIMLLFLRSCDSSFKLSPKTRTEGL